MNHSGLYVIRPAGPQDAEALHNLAELDSQRPLSGRALVGEIDGEIAAALALDDDRVVADPFRPTAYLAACLRLRAGATRAVERTPSLRDRMRVRVPAVAVA